MPQRGERIGEGADEPSPGTELRDIQPVILRPCLPLGRRHTASARRCGHGPAHGVAPHTALGRNLKHATRSTLVELRLSRIGVPPLTAAGHKQAVLGQAAAVNLIDAAKLLIEEPHGAVKNPPGHLDNRKGPPRHGQQDRILLTGTIPARRAS